MFARHPILRAVLSLLLLWGIGASVVEGAGCDERYEIQGSGIATAEWGHPAGPAAPANACCPCIHTYPGSFTVAVVSAPIVDGYSANYTFLAVNGPDRSPEPLVPPPIV